MSDMADHIGEVPISCTKLFIRYCVQQIQALHRNAIYMPKRGV